MKTYFLITLNFLFQNVKKTFFLVFLIKTDAAATNKGCNSATECLDNECCVSIYQPLGRRQLHGHYSGHCVPMGMDGDGKKELGLNLSVCLLF